MDDKGKGKGRVELLRPFAHTKDKLVQRILNRMAHRSEKGIVKYSNTMETSKKSLFSWISHAQEELLDAVIYLEKVKDIISSKKEEK